MALLSYVGIPRNAPNLQAAREFVDTVLSPDYQRVQAEVSCAGVVNPQTRLDPEFERKFYASPAVVEASQPMPWAVYNAQRTELNNRFQRDIEGK